jgi:hypothetical protein
MGGDLELVSCATQRGCTFKLWIPHGGSLTAELIEAKNEKAEHRVAHDARKSSGPAACPLEGVTVLVVDDSPDNRFMVSRFLRKAGAQVETAENGKQAIEKAGDAEFSVVLMDIQMPVMDGETATRLLRADGYDRPIFALTAHAMKSDRDRAMRLGFDDYLTKPIDRSQLIRRLADLKADDVAEPAMG